MDTINDQTWDVPKDTDWEPLVFPAFTYIIQRQYGRNTDYISDVLHEERTTMSVIPMWRAMKIPTWEDACKLAEACAEYVPTMCGFRDEIKYVVLGLSESKLNGFRALAE